MFYASSTSASRLNGEGKEHNMKTTVAAKGLSNKKLQQLSMKLGEIYVKYAAEPRLASTIAARMSSLRHRKHS